MSRSASSGWSFWIDRGGTFTDCIAVAPDGALHVEKLLSSETAPVDGIRRILERAGAIEAGDGLPACSVKLGTTVATNALLERRGVPTLLVTNRGLGDVTRIGTQARPELFELDIRRPPPVQTETLEIAGRVGARGERIEPLDLEAAERAFVAARARGLRSVAIALMHAYAFPEDERALAGCARAAGFEQVVCSHETAGEIGLLGRSETACVDAYLTPLLDRHRTRLEADLPEASLRFMQSSGGLTDGPRFRGHRALLSGPAGGIVGAARVAAAAGYRDAIGFDMGGTSTDVSLIADGRLDRSFESEVAGLRVKAPMLRIHTVAAGGGSLCRFDGFVQTVGPESAGADPGPICYGRLDDGGSPAASELALTDINLFLGRVQADRFPFPVVAAPVEAALERMREAIAKAGFDRSPDEIAAGFVEIANAGMAQAIQEVSVARGLDPRDHVLVGFGGAGGQHVCAIARSLGMREILLHPLAGLLSAYGIGLAESSWDGQQDAGRALLASGARLSATLLASLAGLDREGRAALVAEGIDPAALHSTPLLDLRYRGTDAVLPIEGGEDADAAAVDWRARFEDEYARRFGYLREGAEVEIVTARVRVRGGAQAAPALNTPPPSGRGPAGSPQPVRHSSVWFPEIGRVGAPVYQRESLAEGDVLVGPAMVLEGSGTIALDPGFRLRVAEAGVLHLLDETPLAQRTHADLEHADPVRLEVFGNRFMSIAEQMGSALKQTAVSTNIKERLDYSCAVFDGDGGLVANAPHIPVHLGAMSATVRALSARFVAAGEVVAGDVWVTNDPFEGGSHLPDVTVVTPVFLPGAPETPAFFVASRGHHADLGGITPGSMPSDSHTLEEEGVLIPPMHLVRGARGGAPAHFEIEALRAVLEGARHPARNPDDNLADLEAMVSANRTGEALLLRFVEEEGEPAVQATMRQLQAASAAKVGREIAKLAPGLHRFEDALDDGTPIVVALDVRGERMTIDFAGSGRALRGNLNAPRAVVEAAVLYALRTLVDERIPLNGGCLHPVEIRVPEGSVLDPPRGAAVVGGNVETSQRVVDVLLAALGRAAASQGTMNNVTFGDARFGYYETLGGGAGAGPGFDGESGVHTHMTNTRVTDPEIIEARYPVVLTEFSLRRGSGGAGRHHGGDGLVRGYRFLAPVTATLLTQRRTRAPFGLEGGRPGQPGANWRIDREGRRTPLPGQCSVDLAAGEGLRIETPGGGGYGPPAE